MKKAEIVTGATVVARAEATERIEPCEVPLDDPAMASQAVLRFDAAPGDPVFDATYSARVTAFPEIVSLVGMGFVRTTARATTAGAFERRNGVQQGLEELTVVDVRRGQEDRERDALGVRHKMALAARSAFIRRIRADDVAPLFAATVELSRAARLQSISPAQLNSRSSIAWSSSQIPRRVQFRNRRQQVEPLPQPISSGSICHGSAARRTKRMPVNTRRFDTRGRPPFFPGLRSWGSSGSMRHHRSSLTRGFMSHGRRLPTF